MKSANKKPIKRQFLGILAHLLKMVMGHNYLNGIPPVAYVFSGDPGGHAKWPAK